MTALNWKAPAASHARQILSTGCRFYRGAEAAPYGTNAAMKTSLVLVLVAVMPACKSSDARNAEGVPCATSAIEQFSTRLSAANGFGDLGKPELAAAKAAVTGKRFAFDGCVFTSQGSDQVSFAATAGGKQLTCIMAGGEEGVTRFRRAAMAFDLPKLRLDVRGTVNETGTGDFKRLDLVDCEIVPHE